MSQTSLRVILGFIVLFIVIMLIKLLLSNNAEDELVNTDYVTVLNWDPDETIHVEYDKCKNINRSQYINRLFKKDFRLPMCPESYVVLYDQHQNIVFIFNEKNNENPKILTIDVTCDNSTGMC